MTSEKLKAHWWQNLADYTAPQARTMLFLGFSSGLPLFLVFGTLSLWLREAGVDRSTIGFVSWVALAYAFKWVWSPVVDRLPIPLLNTLLGRRRSWMLLSQLAVATGLLFMATVDPAQNLPLLVGWAVFVAFSSATQDIVVDAYRIESADVSQQGVLAATYMVGYRLAMITASAGAIWIAAWAGVENRYIQDAWQVAYSVMAGLMLVGVITTLLVREPELLISNATQQAESAGISRLHHISWLPAFILPLADWFWRAVASPFADFIRRYRWQAVLLLALIASYRISDIVLGVIASVFYLDMGFSKIQIAEVSKLFGITMTLLGAVLGGLMVSRFGVMRILFIGALLSAATNLLFLMLAQSEPEIVLLMMVVSADNLSGGLAMTAFVAYMSNLTNVSYSATQYALFSSVMLLLPKFVGGFSGVMVDEMGYATFFMLTAAMGIPVLILVLLAWRYAPVKSPDE